MPMLQILVTPAAPGDAPHAARGRDGTGWSIADLRRAMAADGWHRHWRLRAWSMLSRHDVVPGLIAGPGFEVGGDPRGPGWLELRILEAQKDGGETAEVELQRLLEVTRRPWGVLALLPRRRTLPARLVEAVRDPAAGRRLAAAAAERLLARA